MVVPGREKTVRSYGSWSEKIKGNAKAPCKSPIQGEKKRRWLGVGTIGRKTRGRKKDEWPVVTGAKTNRSIRKVGRKVGG